MVIWITGLSAAGKSTLSLAFQKKFKAQLPSMILLDGDAIRELYGNDLGFAESDRVKQIQRIQKLARFLDQQSMIVVVAALYSNPELMEANRQMFSQYYEVLLETNLDVLQTRETKGIYAGAMRGEIKNVVGVDIPWQPPRAPHLVFDMSNPSSPDHMAEKLFESIFGSPAVKKP